MKNLLFAAVDLVNRWKEESELESVEVKLYAVQTEAVEKARAVQKAGSKDAKAKSIIITVFLRDCKSYPKNYGLKFGIVNWIRFFESFQVLGINIADAVQIGIVNDDAPVQIGIWNYCPGSYLPHFPLINFDMGKQKE